MVEMPTQIDFSKSAVEQSSDQSFTPIPAGTYNATIFDVALKETKNGQPMLNIQYRIADGQYENRRVFGMVILAPTFTSGSNNFTLIQWLRALGQDVDSGSPKVPSIPDLKGEPIVIRVGIEPWDGKDRNVVKGYQVEAPAPTKPVEKPVTGLPGKL